jgi:protein-tyrosine phosphatase
MKITFEKLHNFRDIGGAKTTDGRAIKGGILYRSGELSRLTRLDQERLQALQVKLICDLRSSKERNNRPSKLSPNQSLQIANIPFHDEPTQDGSRRRYLGFLVSKTGDAQFETFIRNYYHHIISSQMARIGEALRLLSRPENLPALVHCTAGKDRTGILIALIQLLVGVPYEAVREEYRRTDEYYAPLMKKFSTIVRVVTLFQASRERISLIMRTYPELLDELYTRILQEHGSIEDYLCSACGVPKEDLQTLKESLLAP